MDYVIRPVRAEEWAKARELRLAALQDPLASIAFLETYEDAVVRPDSFWQERTASAAAGREVIQFIGEAPDGSWDGTVSLLVERPGAEARVGKPAAVEQTHVVGVFVRPEARGSGLADALFRAALEWSWALESPRVERVRLIFHADNVRAEALYRRAGFVPSADTSPIPGDEMAREYEVRREAA
ncbi:GNAT superfamily N-acetyltransferase [Streptomyces sp. V4I23]|uniref:GNAT family N-acetyltransferase n=1 Tax=Streptomyces sp. V4I23 TaxID=3042282 RepID=UPI00278B2E2C|nr:GNAT family N-acetyltransferase [Streptomyces sp. V4I23]MDQ1009859.1 GNAT superfamily N-acetyltransferase [Streptomyces sp. V4I23]